MGGALVRVLADRYMGRGRPYVHLSDMHDNEGAITLYRKLGFTRVAAVCVKRKNPINTPLFAAPPPGLEELNPYARIIAEEALRRGIRVEVTDPEWGEMRLSVGGRTVLTRESLSEFTTAVAMSRCDDKRVTRRIMERAGVRVARGARAGEGELAEATALMAVLSAAVGDQRAPRFWAYAQANPETDRLEALTALAFASRTLEHLAVQPASFAYTVDGTRTVVELQSGDGFEIRLTAAQLATLKIERLAGTIGVATTWREPVRPAAFQADPDITFTRTVDPSTNVSRTELVRVVLQITFGPQTASGCHQVTEIVPSGLAPVGSLASWIDPDSEQPPEPGVVMPYDQTGQRVSFCAEPTPTQRILFLRYYARVVTPGTYAWEPAIAESQSQEGRAALTAPSTITIR